MYKDLQHNYYVTIAFFLKLINKQNMTWINKSIETHSFFHILSLPFITTPIPLQYLSSIILWL